MKTAQALGGLGTAVWRRVRNSCLAGREQKARGLDSPRNFICISLYIRLRKQSLSISKNGVGRQLEILVVGQGRTKVPAVPTSQFLVLSLGIGHQGLRTGCGTGGKWIEISIGEKYFRCNGKYSVA